MKKLINVSALFGIVALVILLAAGSASAGGLSQPDNPGEPEVEPGSGQDQVELEIIGPVYESPSLREPGTNKRRPPGTAVRINFKQAGQEARRGLYIVQETNGQVVASWYALDGWEDSGWFPNAPLSTTHVKLQVLYYPGPNTTPTVMKILNHSPNSPYGWATEGRRHAIEVAWPE